MYINQADNRHTDRAPKALIAARGMTLDALIGIGAGLPVNRGHQASSGRWDSKG